MENRIEKSQRTGFQNAGEKRWQLGLRCQWQLREVKDAQEAMSPGLGDLLDVGVREKVKEEP